MGGKERGGKEFFRFLIWIIWLMVVLFIYEIGDLFSKVGSKKKMLCLVDIFFYLFYSGYFK